MVGEGVKNHKMKTVGRRAEALALISRKVFGLHVAEMLKQLL